MTTVQFTKVAFYDPIADEFYIGDSDFLNPIFGSFEKAKLYVGDRMELLSIFNSVQFRSNRDLIVLDVLTCNTKLIRPRNHLSQQILL